VLLNGKNQPFYFKIAHCFRIVGPSDGSHSLKEGVHCPQRWERGAKKEKGRKQAWKHQGNFL